MTVPTNGTSNKVQYRQVQDGSKTYLESDPVTYDSEIKAFNKQPLPSTEQQWVERAQQIASILSADIVERDARKASPRAEVDLLKASKVTLVLGDPAYGGGGQNWDVAYKVIRAVSAGDGSIGQILGYHLLWSYTASVVGTKEQASKAKAEYTKNNLFFGGAVNPRDSDLNIKDLGTELSFSGHKFFSTGGVISDLTILEGVLEGTDSHVFAIVPTQQSGIVFAHDWDSLGQRLTESGSVTINDVRVQWADALGFENKKPGAVTPHGSLLLPLIQLVFTNIYTGISRGALDKAAKYTATSTRAWPYGGDNKDKAVDEFYILSQYGRYQALQLATEALADQVGGEISPLVNDQLRNVTSEQRGQVAVRIAAAKIHAVECGLEITQGIFEVTGARASSPKVGLDVYWRNLRTHSLHDPIAYKKREVGRYVLVGEFPEPTWYT